LFRHRKRDLIEHAKAFDAFSVAFRSFETLSKLPADVNVGGASSLGMGDEQRDPPSSANRSIAQSRRPERRHRGMTGRMIRDGVTGP
jgi:hypothetical protein